MNILNPNVNINKPTIYECGTDFMWTHPHISKQLLEVHLNPDMELASRRATTISKTVNWIESQLGEENLNVLDLGCGPGLYCERLAQNGHKVSGVDISQNSISYAKESAKQKGLTIDYQCEDYTSISFVNSQFDLVMMIFCDFCVLKPEQQKKLIENVYKCLKPGGKFIFDVMAKSGYDKSIIPRTWEFEMSGFWRDSPYFYLHESIPYNDDSVVLSQNIVIDEKSDISVYRFWTKYFSKEMITSLVKTQEFSDVQVHESVIPDSDYMSGDDVYFVVALKG